MQYAVHTYVLKQQYSLRYQHQKVGMQFVSITIDMLQIPEKLLLHRILSSCAKRICVARCLKLSLLLLKQIFTRKLEEFLFRKMVEQIINNLNSNWSRLFIYQKTYKTNCKWALEFACAFISSG